MEIDEIAQTLSVDENLENKLADKLNPDLNLNVNGKLFKCYRSTLTAASPFFESKLKSNKNKNELEIDWHDKDTFQTVLDYIATGKLVLDQDNVDRVLELSHHLSINKLKSYCEQYIEQFINLNDCLKYKELCENLKLSNKITEHCLNYINDNLMEILESSEFLDLSYRSVENFFTDPQTGCDNIPLLDLIKVLDRWVNKDVDERALDYQKLLSVLDWSNCPSELFDYLKKEKLFDESKLCLYCVLSTMEQNNVDLDSDLKSTYLELKKSFESEEVQNNSTRTDQQTVVSSIKSARNSKRGQQVNHFSGAISEEKSSRQGKRQIKRKFNSQEWVTANANSNANSTAKKKKTTSTNDMISETDRAVYMIKVNSTGTEKINAGKVINQVSLVDMSNEKETITTATTGRQRQQSTSSNNQAASLQIEQNDSNQEFDESEYDIEMSSDNKELLSMKTEYSVRGKKQSATLAQWKEGVKCPKCTYVGHSAPRLEQHLSKVHQEDTTYTCKYCEFTCKWNREYYKHMKTHFKGPPYNCSECDYTCDRVQFILSHLMRHTDERPFSCDQCDFRSRTKGNLVVHYRIHTGEKPYKCQYCDKKFAMKNTLDQHMATHRDDRPYLCDKCGFTTKYQSHLLSHKRIHTGNVFYCDQPNCSYFSPRKSQLAAHTRSHLSIRTHVCSTCGRAFIERSHLIRHERIHLEEKPFKCEQCDYGSTRRDKLKEHVIKHHNQTGEKLAVTKPKKSKKNEASVLNNSSSNKQSSQQQIQFVQQIHFENADQIPEEVREQIMAHYQNSTIDTQNVTLTIGENVYESELIVTPSTPTNATNSNKNAESTTSDNQIQITNVADQDTDLVEFVLV